MSGPERERFEARLAEDPDALRQLVEQEKMDVALSMLLANLAVRESSNPS